MSTTGYAYAYFSQGMITYEFDGRNTANADQYCCLHSVTQAYSYLEDK
ncbi:MAG: hypothetical protein RMY36_023880 [Nostoc sp. SerVER01]|nr:hypothetical protein [Nostoc sp. SerVER01]MDZ8080873.1 hypothetical protein [Nostoc sp. DcaGUA01]